MTSIVLLGNLFTYMSTHLYHIIIEHVFYSYILYIIMIDIGKTDHVTMMYTVIKLYVVNTIIENIDEHCNKL